VVAIASGALPYRQKERVRWMAEDEDRIRNDVDDVDDNNAAEAVGTTGGAIAGAAAGSFFGPLGTVAGGVLGNTTGDAVDDTADAVDLDREE
jgi:outer membrane lipoprotein SlyB